MTIVYRRDGVVPVSAVIPCYQCVTTLARAVHSVMRQSVRPFELILVDDASTDGTRTLMSRLIREFAWHRIIAVHIPENRGAASARNSGWAAATGTHIAFLDADDTWHPQKIELQYAWMLIHPQVMLTGHQDTVAGSTSDLGAEAAIAKARRIGAIEQLILNRFSTRTVMLVSDIPFRFEEGQTHSEDYLLWTRIVLSKKVAYTLSAKLAYAYKPRFGAAGLSSDHWKMQRGILGSLRLLVREGLLSHPLYVLLCAWNNIKFLRRLLISSRRQHGRG